MDAETRKYNDEHYDMWSTDGPWRVIGVSADERNITMSDWWHEYFFWKPQAKKIRNFDIKKHRQQTAVGVRESSVSEPSF